MHETSRQGDVRTNLEGLGQTAKADKNSGTGKTLVGLDFSTIKSSNGGLRMRTIYEVYNRNVRMSCILSGRLHGQQHQVRAPHGYLGRVAGGAALVAEPSQARGPRCCGSWPVGAVHGRCSTRGMSREYRARLRTYPHSTVQLTVRRRRLEM